MVVAIQKELVNLKNTLGERGFEVVDLEGYSYPIDAMIYEGNAFQISQISRNNMPEVGMSTRGNYGIFMINASGKTATLISVVGIRALTVAD